MESLAGKLNVIQSYPGYYARIPYLFVCILTRGGLLESITQQQRFGIYQGGLNNPPGMEASGEGGCKQGPSVCAV